MAFNLHTNAVLTSLVEVAKFHRLEGTRCHREVDRPGQSGHIGFASGIHCEGYRKILAATAQVGGIR